MTVSNSEFVIPTSEVKRPLPRPMPTDAGETPENAEPEVADSDVWRERLLAFLAYFTPPAVLTERPASMPELSAYAHRGDWTKRKAEPARKGVPEQKRGPVRTAGIWWHRLVGLPVTVVCRYVEWIAQRPGRAIPVFVLWKAFISTGAGPWIVQNLLAPVGRVAGWIFL